MIQFRPAAARGHTRLDWLDSWHSFAFGSYRDPANVGFGPLRVINDDRVVPGRGFGRHGHADMEILTYVISGELRHQDSMGNLGVIRAGDAQKMSAGTGVEHSEFNGSAVEPVHFLQIWIEPDQDGIAPAYAQATLDQAARRGRLSLLAAPPEHGSPIPLRQDAFVHTTLLARGEAVELAIGAGRLAYVHVAAGAVTLGQHTLAAGDGAAISRESAVRCVGASDSLADVLLFDLPP